MKIISKFKDYYDGYSYGYNNDPKVRYWIRKTENIDISKYLLTNLEKDILRTYNNYHSGYLIIAGKIYPFVSIHTEADIHVKPKTEYFFNPDDLMKRHAQEKNKIMRARKHRNWKWSYWFQSLSKRDVTEFFNKKYPDMSNLCIEYNTPIILIEPRRPGYQEREKTYRTCVKNINLKDYGLSKVFKAPEIYQILDVFINNVLVDDKMPMSPMTDLEKVQSHGFDTKISFRKPKQNKKK